MIELPNFIAVKTGEFTYEIRRKNGTPFHIGEHMLGLYEAGKVKKYG